MAAGERSAPARTFERLLVTGGAGFIGSNFVRRLRQAHPETGVVVLDKLTYAGNRANLEGVDGYTFVEGDICDRGLVDELAAGVDAIVNFAAETHVDRSLFDPTDFVQTDVAGTSVLCDAARRHGHRVFLLVSTDEVYGDVAAGRSRESDPLRPRSPYSASKAGAEHIAAAYGASFGLPVLVTRGSNTYGPYQFPEKIIPLLVVNALENLPLPLYGDGLAVRDYLHVADHCAAIDQVLHRAAAGSVYNIGTGHETSGLELARKLLDEMGRPHGLIQFVEDRRGHDRRYALDTAKLEDDLGWRPEVDLDDGLRQTVRWYADREDWWRPLRGEAFWTYYRRNYRPLRGA